MENQQILSELVDNAMSNYLIMIEKGCFHCLSTLALLEQDFRSMVNFVPLKTPRYIVGHPETMLDFEYSFKDAVYSGADYENEFRTYILGTQKFYAVSSGKCDKDLLIFYSPDTDKPIHETCFYIKIFRDDQTRI